MNEIERYYRSAKGETHTYYQWYHIARAYYSLINSGHSDWKPRGHDAELLIPMPSDWWQRWYKVLKLKEVMPGRRV